MQRVNKAVCAKLKELLPGVNVFPALAEEDAKYPFVVYNMDGFSVSQDKDSGDREARYTIDIWDNDFDRCDEMADTIDAGFKGEIAEGVEVEIVGGASGFAGGYFTKLNFDIEIDE